MRLEKALNISVYLTLAVASLGLSSAERYFIPEIYYFLVPVLVLLGVAFAVEGRWALTPLASNVIGLVIFAAAVVWVVRGLTSPTSQVIENAPYPAAFLPFGGPVLMVVMLAKLFRPKGPNDYWGLHVIGLMEIALGCILAAELDFSIWLFVYLAFALWSLMLFLLYRESVRATETSIEPTPKPAAPWPWWGLRMAPLKALVVVTTGCLLFLVMPRHTTERWNLLNTANAAGQIETGFARQLDLTETGRVTVSEEVAMEVSVEDAHGNPKTDLDPFQRWRGITYDVYQRGNWAHRRWGRPAASRVVPVRPGARAALLDAGPGSFFVTYDFDLGQAGGLFLAEPVLYPLQNRLAVSGVEGNLSWMPIYYVRDGILLAPGRETARRIRYRQVLPGAPEARDQPAADITDDYRLVLTGQPVAGIRTWTWDVLKKLVAQGQLRAADIATEPPFSGFLPPEKHVQVALALSNYLATSGDFLYRLELRRSDLAADPTEDFLRNVRQGFCGHFATGLTLMLRSVGIPARVVSGYRGAEHQADENGDKAGRYVVRKSHAHSWVEALLTRPNPDGGTEHYWLMLEPTPGSDFDSGDGLTWSQWWAIFRSTIRDLWNAMILDYNAERQTDTAWAVWDRLSGLVTGEDTETTSRDFWARNWPWLAVPLGLMAAGWWWWRSRNASRQSSFPMEYDFYRRWLDALSRHGRLRPAPAHTPMEFAAHVAHACRHQPQGGFIEHLSRQVVRLYYQARYGNQPLADAERDDLNKKLDRLESILRARVPNQPSPT
jgi:hypothetical protein